MLKPTINLLVITLFSFQLTAQIFIKGQIRDANTFKPLIGVSVMIKGKQIGTISDKFGNFTLKSKQDLPLTLVSTSVGYKSQENVIANSYVGNSILLQESSILTQEVIVSASRTEESSLSVLSSVETMNVKAIRESTATNFYEELRNLRGVDFTTNSVFFSSVNIRGANSSGNTRLTQIIDGMDNQAPGLNFAIGNLVGIPELDISKVDLISGSSSALYGSAAMSGAILMNSKNPFDFQGLSVNLKTGIMDAQNRKYKDGSVMNATPFTDMAIRFAKSFNDKIAFKINVSYQKASDWQANDSTDVGYRNGFNYENGTALNNPGYNGVNYYGDEVNTNLANLRPVFNQLINLPVQALPNTIAPLVVGIKQISQLTKVPINTLVNEFIPSVTVGRTGYKESDLADYESYNLKLNGALHYRISDKMELILAGNYGSGTTVYTASDRYFIKNFSMGQYKMEIRGANFFLRSYTTQERSGDTYAIGIQSALMNETWKKSFDNTNLQTITSSWFPQYGLSYTGNAMQVFSNEYQKAMASGISMEQAYKLAIDAKNMASNSSHLSARKFADTGRPTYGTEDFIRLADRIAKMPIPEGAKFLDKTNLYHTEFAFNFNKLKFVNLLLGGSYRMFELNSDGTIFTKNPDTGEEYKVHEIGAYFQAIKTFWKDKIRFTMGLRYDKNLSFEGAFTPRVGMVISPKQNHNFRMLYQTGFRLPTTQDQYIDLSLPGQHNLGGVRKVIDKYDLNGKAITQTSFNTANPVIYTYGSFSPERVKTFEFGYKALITKVLFFDVLYYYSNFVNKLASINVVKVKEDKSTEIFNIVESVPDNTFQHGFAFGLDFSLPAKFSFLVNYSKDVSGGALFNSEKFAVTNVNGTVLAEIPPRNRWNFSIGNENLFKTGISFKINYRYQPPATNFTSIVNKSAKATPNQPFIGELSLIDAQISKKIIPIKSIIKVGGTNLGGGVYRTTIGNPYIGTTYYISLLFDELLN